VASYLSNNSSPQRSRKEELREQAQVRVEFIWTIIWDCLVVITAICARFVTLWVIRLTTPVDTHSWVVRDLEWIGDVGIVSAAGVFAAFDLSKRVVVSGRSLWRTIKGVE
jgi:hypothetical protein